MTTNTHSPVSSGTFWAWVPAGLLGAMFLGLGSMAYVAVNDPGFALEPNYYDKAVHWDRSQAEAQASRALGLQLGLEKALALDTNGQVRLTLTVSDRSGAALGGAEVKIEAFPNAAASRVEVLQLKEISPGVYSGEIARGARGLWELRITVKRSDLTYREVLRRDVVKGRSGRAGTTSCRWSARRSGRASRTGSSTSSASWSRRCTRGCTSRSNVVVSRSTPWS